ncbi:MAG: hypothetical protein HFF99_06530 [Oscillibacter sp.]|nr:hypothetical protein [uncultured Oscillibacter sp.]MCI8971107.1 hypothetical protein [Oscillibacter sp.]
MAIDKSHPMYQEYIGECMELAKRGQEEAAKVPYSAGRMGRWERFIENISMS